MNALTTYAGWMAKARELLADQPEWTGLVDSAGAGYIVKVDGEIFSCPRSIDPAHSYTVDDLMDMDYTAWGTDAWDGMTAEACQSILTSPMFVTLTMTAETATAELAAMRQEVRTRAFRTADDAVYFSHKYAPTDPGVSLRVLVERAIVRAAARTFLADGYKVRMHDGESWATGLESDLSKIMAEVGACDEERLYVWEPSKEAGKDGKYIGSLFLVYGNSGWDVVGDLSTTVDPMLTGVWAMADAFGEVM